MKFPPYWTRTERINKSLYEIDVLREAFALYQLPPDISLQIQRRSLLKSSLYSARIEGNPLLLDEVIHSDLANSEERHTREVANISKALELVQRDRASLLSLDLLKQIHQIVLDGLSSEAGHLRTDNSAIYNQAGVAVYLTPPPGQVIPLLDEWYVYGNSSTDPVLVKASIAHIWFEKIHPFLDGNGRVGRICTSHILSRNGYGFEGIVPFEEYLDSHRDEYYEAISIDRPDVTEFVTFFLDAFLAQARSAIQLAMNPPVTPFSNLLPRRAEIVSIIKDHKLVSFDFLARRFQAIPSRTLHHDLSQLSKAGYVRKLGSTRGVVYVPGEKA